MHIQPAAAVLLLLSTAHAAALPSQNVAPTAADLASKADGKLGHSTVSSQVANAAAAVEKAEDATNQKTRRAHSRRAALAAPPADAEIQRLAASLLKKNPKLSPEEALKLATSIIGQSAGEKRDDASHQERDINTTIEKAIKAAASASGQITNVKRDGGAEAVTGGLGDTVKGMPVVGKTSRGLLDPVSDVEKGVPLVGGTLEGVVGTLGNTVKGVPVVGGALGGITDDDVSNLSNQETRRSHSRRTAAPPSVSDADAEIQRLAALLQDNDPTLSPEGALDLATYIVSQAADVKRDNVAGAVPGHVEDGLKTAGGLGDTLGGVVDTVGDTVKGVPGVGGALGGVTDDDVSNSSNQKTCRSHSRRAAAPPPSTSDVDAEIERLAAYLQSLDPNLSSVKALELASDLVNGP